MHSQDALTEAQIWKQAGRQVAIATVVATWGSAPRPVGSHLIVDENLHFLGSISGGCVENELLHTAQEVIATGACKMVEFGVSNQVAWRAGLPCGGRISVFVERVD